MLASCSPVATLGSVEVRRANAELPAEPPSDYSSKKVEDVTYYSPICMLYAILMCWSQL